MHILKAPRRAGSPRYTPREIIRLRRSEEGQLDLSLEGLHQVAPTDLVLAAVVAKGRPLDKDKDLILLLVIRGQTRPVRVKAKGIAYDQFPGGEKDSIEDSLRAFFSYLDQQNSALRVTEETVTFLRGGQATDVLEVDFASLATSWLAALDPRLEEEHPLLLDPSALPLLPAPSNEESTVPDRTTITDFGPGSQAPAPPLLAPSPEKLTYGVQRLEAATEGLGVPLPEVEVSMRRRLQLIPWTLGMVLPFLIYLAVVGSIGFVTYRYAREAVDLFEVSDQGERFWSLGDLDFMIPMGFFLLFLITFLEPLFVRRQPPRNPRALDRGKEMVLFSFMDRLARTLGAPAPKAIELTTDADVGVHRRPRRQGGQFTLTLGLPLLAGLSLEQLAAIVTQELAAFIRRPGQRSILFIRRVDDRFNQLVADCADLQDKRRVGIEQLVRRAGATRLMDSILSLLFGITQRFFDSLARITGFFRTRAELWLSADIREYQESLVGSSVVETTETWSQEIYQAQQRLMLEFNDTQVEAPPPDHLPAQVVLFALEARAASEDPSTPPAIPTGPKARYRSNLPASLLFHGFVDTARQLTRDFYGGLESPRYDLEPFAEYLHRHSGLLDDELAAQRFFGGALLRRRALPVAATVPEDRRSIQQQMAALTSARKNFDEGLTRFRHLLTQVDRAAAFRMASREARALMSVGIREDAQAFGISEWTPQAAEAMEQKALNFLRQATPMLKDHEKQAGRCLMSSLVFLSPTQDEDTSDWAQQAPKLLASLTAVNRTFPLLLRLSDQTALLVALRERQKGLKGESRLLLDPLLERETAALGQGLEELHRAFIHERHHFHFDGFDLNLAIWGVPGDTLEVARDLLRRVHSHYRACLSRLAAMAESIERTMGFDTPTHRTPLEESRPWPF